MLFERVEIHRQDCARMSAVAALRVPAYRWWFGTQILSTSGGMAQAVGLAWLVLELGGHGLALGLMSAAAFGPALLLGPAAGALLDHVDHRRALITTQILFTILSALLAVLNATGVVELWMVYAIALATGVVFSVDAPARQVYVLELVGPERTASAVGMFEVIVNASRVLGPAAGGVLIATIGVTACFAANAASFVPTLLVLLQLQPTRRLEPPGRLRVVAAVREGLSYVRHRPAIAALIAMAVASTFIFNPGVALPVLATTVFDLGSIGYGALVAAFGLGAIPGALAAARTVGEPSARLIRVLCLLTGGVVIATALAPTAWLAYAGMAVTGFVSIWFIALANTFVQLRSEARIRGRVMGLWTMALPGMNPVTALVAGGVTQGIGARVGWAVGGASLVGAALAGWRALSE
jgi:MFS family permease